MKLPDVPQRCGYDHYLGQCDRCSARHGTFRNPEAPEPKPPTVKELAETVEKLRAIKAARKPSPE